LKVAADTPLRTVYSQLTGTWNEFDGAAAKLEVGVHPWAGFSAYAAGTYDANGPGAEAGVRYEWSW
jgi:hypothetical protein